MASNLIQKFVTAIKKLGSLLGLSEKPTMPSQMLTTELSWNDLKLNSSTMQQVKKLESWLKRNSDLKTKDKIKPGYRVIFHGPPDTGKTLTASLLGKEMKREVYRIDLSNILSKYIGETEKNLTKLFNRAENKDWILFFDEADALFGKRTSVNDSHDRYANQETEYLIQKIENYTGLVILVSNMETTSNHPLLQKFDMVINFKKQKDED